jgi:hypothetical protein
MTRTPAPRRAPDRTIRVMAAGEEPKVVATLVEAFDSDPFARWLFPDPDKRRDSHRFFFSGTLDERPPGAIVETTEDFAAAAIWYPPGGVPDLSPPPDSTAAVAAFFAEIAAATPSQPFWYLAFLGARRSGAGGGSSLLWHRLAAIRGKTALWTANEANLGFYGRFGFAPVSEHHADGASAWWLTRGDSPSRAADSGPTRGRQTCGP